MYFVSIAMAVIPAILLIVYFYRKDKARPEPKKMIALAFVIGIVSLIPAVILALSFGFMENTANVWVRVFVQSFITAALVEELSKFFLFRLVIFKNKNFDEVTDGIVYMAVISLGFACLENILYSAGDIATGVIRAFTAVPGHAMWSGVMGYFFGLAKMRGKGNASLYITGLTLGIFYHGIYDFVLFAGSDPLLNENWFGLVFLIIPILIVCGLQLRGFLKKAQKIDSDTFKEAAAATQSVAPAQQESES